jgi:hypothetical protein
MARASCTAPGMAPRFDQKEVLSLIDITAGGRLLESSACQLPDTGQAKKDRRKPVYSLLSKLANQADINFFAALLLTDDAKGIVDFIANFPKPLVVSDSPPKRSDRFKGRALAAF